MRSDRVRCAIRYGFFGQDCLCLIRQSKAAAPRQPDKLRMIQSMTGYATTVRELPQGTLTLELRSVNSRFLDVQFRIAEDLRATEAQLRELIMARIRRGKVDCRMGFTPAPLAQLEA